jgi:hypothetical protein
MKACGFLASCADCPLTKRRPLGLKTPKIGLIWRKMPRFPFYQSAQVFENPHTWSGINTPDPKSANPSEINTPGQKSTHLARNPHSTIKNSRKEITAGAIGSKADQPKRAITELRIAKRHPLAS